MRVTNARTLFCSRYIIWALILFSLAPAHAKAAKFCLAQLLKDSGPSVLHEEVQRHFEAFEKLGQQIKSDKEVERLKQRAEAYRSYLSSLGIKFDHVVDPELGNLFYIKSTRGKSCSRFCKFPKG